MMCILNALGYHWNKPWHQESEGEIYEDMRGSEMKSNLKIFKRFQPILHVALRDKTARTDFNYVNYAERKIDWWEWKK